MRGGGKLFKPTLGGRKRRTMRGGFTSHVHHSLGGRKRRTMRGGVVAPGRYDPYV
jgi:hypothetical protein